MQESLGLLSKNQLQKELKKLHSVINSLPGMILSIDISTGKIAMCNHTTLENLGYEKTELIGKGIFELYHPDCHDNVKGVLILLQQQGYVNHIELMVVTKKGSIIDVDLSASIYTDPQTGKQFSRSIWLDITERKQLYREKIEALEQLAEEKHEHLMTEKRIRACLTHFVDTFSHENRNALNGIMSSGKLTLAKIKALQQSCEQPSEENTKLTECIRHLEDILVCATRSCSIIDNSLSLSRDQNNTTILSMDVFPLDLIVKELKSTYMSKAEEKNIELNFIGFPKNLFIYGDQRRIYQILTNLLLNALTFTNEGCVTVTCCTQHSDINNGLTLRFEIEDTGVGFSMNDADIIFEKFSRLKSGVQRTGIGLGLSIVKQLLSLMRGNISVSSIPGEGSIFSCELLVRSATQEERENYLERKDYSNGSPLSSNNQLARTFSSIELNKDGIGETISSRILIIDNHMINNMMLSEMLKGEGYEVTIVENGIDAQHCLAEKEFDLIFVHANLLEIDDELDNITKNREKGNSGGLSIKTPLVVIKPANGQKAHGADDERVSGYLTIPYTQLELMEVLTQHIVHKILPKLTLLIVEDDNVNQMILEEILITQGYDITIAENGIEALDQLEEKSFNLILMDVNMPRMNGLETTQIIRQREKTGRYSRKTPIIGLSANTQQKDIDMAFEAGMDDYLSKPFRHKHLLNVVNIMISQGVNQNVVAHHDDNDSLFRRVTSYTEITEELHQTSGASVQVVTSGLDKAAILHNYEEELQRKQNEEENQAADVNANVEDIGSWSCETSNSDSGLDEINSERMDLPS